MPNYSYVIDSSFRPFDFSELLQPWVMYGNAYKEVENSYNDLVKGADTFKYLAEVTADDPRAKAMYEGYINDLKSQAEDLARNGLSMNNRRALTSLKQRYQGEIGMLERADEQLRELQKGRNALAAAGKTILYGNDNPRLSDFLGDGNSFNRYAIDAADLRTRGNALGKAMSSREYSNDEAGNLLQDQYRIWRQTHGIRDIGTFMQSDAVKKVVDNELIASGAADNLKGRNLKLARQNLMNGIYESVIYEEAYKPLENGEYMSAKERASQAQAEKSLELQANLYGKTWDKSKGRFVDNPDLLNVKGKSSSSSRSGSSGGRSGSSYVSRNKNTIMVGAKTGKIYRDENNEEMTEGAPLTNIKEARLLNSQEKEALVGGQQGVIADPILRQAIGSGSIDDYVIKVIPAGSTEVNGSSGWYWPDDNNEEDIYIIEPRESKRAGTVEEFDELMDSGTNDLPD